MDQEEIYGFIFRAEGSNPFIYSNFILRIMPNDDKQWEKWRTNLWGNIVNEINSSTTPSKEWVKENAFYGITNKDKKIIFKTKGLPSNDNGFEMHEIKHFYEYDNRVEDGRNVSSVRLFSEDIDIFYNPKDVYSQSVSFDEHKSNNKISVDIDNKRNKPTIIGEYNYKETDVTVSIYYGYTWRPDSTIPLESYTVIELEFHKKQNLEFIIEVVLHIKMLLVYLHNRKNIAFSKIRTKSIESKNSIYQGRILVNEKIATEQNKKKKEQCIKYQNIGNSISLILKSIVDNTIYFAHIPKNIDEKYKINVDRIILTFAAFERELNNLYDKDFNRSEEYKKKKNEILKLLEENKNNCKGKEKEAVKRFKKMIEKSDLGIGDRIALVIKDCRHYLDIFLRRLYGKDDEQIIKDISCRMNRLRNNIAHGNLDFDINPMNVTDFQFLEIILYAMRMNKMNIEEKKCKNALSSLFGYNLPV